jgi:hypothetical protein
VTEKSYIRQIREALVARLQADVALAAYMTANNGHWYTFRKEDKLPGQLTKSDCPAIVVHPARMVPIAAGNVIDQETWELKIGCTIDSREVGDAEDFWTLVAAAVQIGKPSMGIAASWAPELAFFTSVNFDLLKDAENQAVSLYWGAEGTLNLRLRRIITT